jgi:hypothetical protein
MNEHASMPARSAATAEAGEAIAVALGSGDWSTVQADVVRLFPDGPATENQLRADANILSCAANRERQRLMHDVAHAWEQRLAVAVGRNPALEPSVVKLAERPASRTVYTQHNTPGNGGVLFANQGGPQNVYRSP